MSELVAPTEDPTRASVVDLAAAIARRDVSPVEVMDAFLDRISASNTNAVVVVDIEGVRAAARSAAEAVARGKVVGPLHGVPFTVKDSIATAGIVSSAGSRLLAGYVPAHDAPAVARLRAAGAILIGKTNCPEFALEPRTYNDLYGETRNPWDPSLSPGGSSGGESAALADSCAAFGVGSDFGGSVRFPAHCTGLFGLRPTIGRVPLTGHLPTGGANTPRGLMSVIGPLARSTRDLAAITAVMGGPDPSDRRTVPVPALERAPVLPTRGDRLQCAWTFGDEGLALTAEVRAALMRSVEALQALGVSVTAATPCDLGYAEAVYSELRETDSLANLRAMSAGREELLTRRMRDILRSPIAQVDHHRYIELLEERDLLAEQAERFFQQHRVLLMPVATSTALPLAATTVDVEGQVQTLFQVVAPCRVITLFGFPAVAVPTGVGANGLPVGVQVVAAPFRETDALAVAALLEKALGGWRAPIRRDAPTHAGHA